MNSKQLKGLLDQMVEKYPEFVIEDYRGQQATIRGFGFEDGKLVLSVDVEFVRDDT